MTRPSAPITPSRRSLRALDALAFLAPDIQGGVGPFLIVFMAGTLAWDPQRIGTVMFVSALVGLAVQAPAGALIDSVRHKPRWIAGAISLIAVSLLVMANWPSFGVILAGQSLIGAAGTLVAPAIAATSLGMVGRAGLDARIGRNAAITAAGTVLWALGTGWVGHAFGPHAMFFYAVAMALPTIAAALRIRHHDIDLQLARGADAEPPTASSPVPGARTARWYDHRLLVLLACAFLFHLRHLFAARGRRQRPALGAGRVAVLFAFLRPRAPMDWLKLVDWQTVGALAGLLAITQGVEKSGMLQAAAQRLLARTTDLRQLALLLTATRPCCRRWSPTT
jgi:MFS family permease